MKILFTASKDSFEGDLDPRFGRAPFFILYDLGTGEWRAHPNDASQAEEGAGVRAAGHALRLGAQAVVTGHCGPKALKILQQSGVRIYQGHSGPCRPILDQVRPFLVGA